MRRRDALWACALPVLAGCGGGGSETEGPGEDRLAQTQLAAAIRGDTRLPRVRAKAVALVARELTAGSGYPAVFIRDLNTFVTLAIEAQGARQVRSNLRLFLEHQGSDGNIARRLARTVDDPAPKRAQRHHVGIEQ